MCVCVGGGGGEEEPSSHFRGTELDMHMHGIGHTLHLLVLLTL